MLSKQEYYTTAIKRSYLVNTNWCLLTRALRLSKHNWHQSSAPKYPVLVPGRREAKSTTTWLSHSNQCLHTHTESTHTYSHWVSHIHHHWCTYAYVHTYAVHLWYSTTELHTETTKTQGHKGQIRLSAEGWALPRQFIKFRWIQDISWWV